jgi:hypothetical protein
LPDWLRIVTLLISTSQAAKAWATSPGLLLILKKKKRKKEKVKQVKFSLLNSVRPKCHHFST